MIGRHLVSACVASSALWLVLHPQPAKAIGSATQSTAPSLYFGQPPPGLTPGRFAPGVVSTDESVELNTVFTPDGREMFFTRIVDKVFTMFHSRFAGGKWSAPVPLMVYANKAKATAVDMSVSSDGKELYFLGQHTHEYTKDPESLDLWVSPLVNGEWTTARVLPPPISTPASESYPVVVGDGSLYFTSNRAGSLGLSDIYRAERLPGGGFAEPVNVGPPINTEFGEGDTFVAPDESYLIMTSRRPGGSGMGDLYVSFRGKDGRWQPPVNLGDTINTDQVEFCPMVTPDGKYLFFSRRWGATWAETTAGDVFWLDIKFLDRFRR